MSVELITAELDAHDALVESCLDASLSFEDFLGAYGDFPARLKMGSDGTSPELAMRMFEKRVQFHSQVAAVLSGLQDGALTVEGADFAPRVGLMRLRSLVARYPGFEVA